MKTAERPIPASASRELSAASKQGYILLTRGGKPVAYVLPTRFYDEEDIGYMMDPAFWKEIAARRAPDGRVSLDEVEARLKAREAAEKKNGKKAISHSQKGKRRASA